MAEKLVALKGSFAQLLENGFAGVADAFAEQQMAAGVKIQQLEKQLQIQAEIVMKLEAENRKLRKDLQAQLVDAKTANVSIVQLNGGLTGTERPTAASSSHDTESHRFEGPDTYDQLLVKYKKLLKTHDNTKRQAGQYKASLEKCNKKIAGAKAVYNSWETPLVKPAVGQSRPYTTPTFNKSFPFDLTPESIRSTATHPRVNNPKLVIDKTVRTNEEDVELRSKSFAGHEIHQLVKGGSLDGPAGAVEDETNVSTQSTCQLQDDESVALAIKVEQNDDMGPEIISHRSLKRHRMPESTHDGHVDKARRLLCNGTSESDGLKVKLERRSASPIGILAVRALANSEDEGQDLDEIPGSVKTPRKVLSKIRKQNSHGNEGFQRHLRSSSLPIPTESIQHRIDPDFQEHISQLHQQSSQPGRDDPHPEDSTMIDAPEHLEDTDHDNDVFVSLEDLEDGLSTERLALQPLDANRPLPYTTPAPKPTTRKERGTYDSTKARAISALAEDGTGYSKSSRRKTSTDCRGEDKIRQLLDGRVDVQTPDSVHPASGKASRHGNQLPSKPQTLSKAKLQTRPGSSGGPSALLVASSKPTATSSFRSGEPSKRRRVSESGATTEEPLRNKDLSQLTLNHFKINPARNQGQDYAFVEVLRQKELRQCLPTCTRAECCGDKFRKMIEMGGAGGRSPPNNLPAAPTPEQERGRSTTPRSGCGSGSGGARTALSEEEMQLLEDQLGPGAEARLRQMSMREIEEALTATEARRMAKRFGKHKAAPHRRSTPPGFWRTGMPSSQEMLQDKEAARQLEREKVEQRWREAMKPGRSGLWLFRDE